MIDIKEIRVGSHVMVDGKRTRLQCLGINENNEPFFLHKIDGDTYDIKIDEIEPIPITEDVLLDTYEKCNNVNDFSYIEKNEQCLYINIFLSKKFRLEVFYHYNEPNICSITVLEHNGSEFGGDTILCEANFVRNLHQLENFVFLATGLELIDD